MLDWSIKLFRLWGIRLELHVTFFLVIALPAVTGWVEAGWSGLLWSLAMVTGIFVCLVLHELGHSLTALRLGIGVRRILLLPVGGMAEFEEIPREPWREFLITIAGPAVNIVIVALLWWIPLPFNTELEQPYSLAGFYEVLVSSNLLMIVFNLLPLFPMDGGRILRAALATRLPYLHATFWAATVGKVFAMVGLVFAVTASWLDLTDPPLYPLAVAFPFLIAVGEVEYRTVKRREQHDDAHWRQTFARLQSQVPVRPADTLTEP